MNQGLSTPPSLANMFKFTYRGQRVSFTESDFGGEPMLTVGARQFRGDQITIEATKLGNIVTVTLAVVLDGDTTLLSLVLPRTLVASGTPTPLKALAIETTVLGTIIGPPLGAGMLYDVEEIDGTATAIVS